MSKALERIRRLCLALPETKEVEAWGHPTFRAGEKMFATFGDNALNLIVGFDRQEELLEDPRFFATPYAAYRGWVSLRIDGETDWYEVAALVQEAYRQVALKRMLQELDGGAEPG
jgi:predicted DNA-binding protein (MmcQ/YjbR family)